MRLLSFAATLALFSCTTSRVEPQFVLKQTLEPQSGLKIQIYEHARNGLRLMLVPYNSPGVVAYVTAFDVGSRFEVQGRTGLAHLFEHMMFRGTPSFPEPFKTLAGWGDQFNAYTSSDLTLYHQTVPSVVLKDVIRFESERMRRLKITREGFNTERGAVVSERKLRTEDAPFGRLYWELTQLAYDRHPYKTGAIGWQEDLDATSFEDAMEFYRRFYAPNRAQVVIVGDFELPQVLAWMERHYGSFEREAFVEPRVEAEPQRKDLRRRVFKVRSENVIMATSWAFSPTFSSFRDAVAESMVCSLLADSERGFLHNEMVRKGLARSVSDSCTPSVDPGLSSVFVAANPGVSVDQIESRFDELLNRFEPFIQESRVEPFKRLYLADQLASLRSPMGIAEQLARLSIVARDPVIGFRVLQEMNALSAKDLRAAWRRMRERARVRVFIQPSEQTEPIRRNQQ
jgi:zinc protease